MFIVALAPLHPAAKPTGEKEEDCQATEQHHHTPSRVRTVHEIDHSCMIASRCWKINYQVVRSTVFSVSLL